MAKRKKKTIDDPIQAELDSIKRLLMLFLVKAGATQGEIGTALGISRMGVSRMFPAKQIKKFTEGK